MELNKYIDHTKLGFYVSKKDITKLCEEAVRYGFKSVCVNPIYVKLAKKLLLGSKVLVCTVIGFPHGTHTTKVKVFEAKDAIKNGADEIDMVINVDFLKEKRSNSKLLKEISSVKKAVGNHTLKVILETSVLTDSEIVRGCLISSAAKADFVKTSTGFGSVGATKEVVRLMVATVPQMQVKASGGIRNTADAHEYIKLGATRIGTSNGVAIVEGEENNANTTY
ncbi:MAG: deoxyribose-phosphate aldolase [Acholeplasmatales bacterium]|jgi:deoxyribose-phosphate aldolase|nr:deoxyribose-phosphate aldolase [Acholeplasmatales bacterium]